MPYHTDLGGYVGVLVAVEAAHCVGIDVVIAGLDHRRSQVVSIVVPHRPHGMPELVLGAYMGEHVES